jgi:hypothetical protein
MFYTFALFLFIGYLSSMADNAPAMIIGWILATWIFVSGLINSFYKAKQ